MDETRANAVAEGFTSVTDEPTGEAGVADFEAQTARLRDEIGALGRSSANLKRALRAAKMGYWEWDASGDDWRGSQQLSDFLMLSSEFEGSYEDYLRYVHPEDQKSVREAVEDAVAHRASYLVDYRVIRADGQELCFQERGVATWDEDSGIRVTAVVQDETDRRSAEQKATHDAEHDRVTELPNRARLMSELRQKILLAEQRSRIAATMVINLDGFRDLNDLHGQESGDALLRAVGQRLRDICGEVGPVACLGGDEFAVVTGEAVHVDDLEVLAKETLSILAKPYEISGAPIHVTASAGTAIYPADASTPINLLQMAQMAVHRAKLEGGDRHEFYNEDMAASVMEHANIRTALVPALKNDEFDLHFQPKISVATGEIVGLEALLRWNSPKFGAVPPGKFIPVAEGSPVMHPLGIWIIEQACTWHRTWLDAACNVPQVAVNVAGAQLRPGFLEIVEKAVVQSGLEPGQLHLELTETALIRNLKVVAPLLNDLREYGVGLSIDDFGTGYSSLSYLQTFPVDTLKIDQSFVRDIELESGSAAIVRATIALAHSLDLMVVAEGVETLEQLQFLQDLRCDQVQGFYFSRPVPAAQVPQLIAAQPYEWAGKG